MKKLFTAFICFLVFGVVVANTTKSNSLVQKNLVEQTDSTENENTEYDITDDCIHTNQFSVIVPVLKWLSPSKQDLIISEFYQKLRKPPKV